jgi:hypothetical protein
MPSADALFAALSVLIGFGVPLLAAEIALRVFQVVGSGLGPQTVDDDAPYLHFEPNQSFFYLNRGVANRGRVNNYGYVNDADYDPEDERTLLAVIGDSYVEAQMVPFPETISGRLGVRVGADGRVYSFGASGASLSQYLAWAEFVRETFHPQMLVVVVVGNDFDGCFYEISAIDGFHYFAERSDGTLQLERIDFHRSWMRDVGRASALLRFAIGRAGLLGRRGSILGNRDGPARSYLGNTRADYDSQVVERSRRAIVAFLGMLPEKSGLAPEHIVLLIDGIRPQLYEGPEALARVDDMYFARMRRELVTAAGSRGYEVIDLQPRFLERHQATGVRFEFERDMHWSGAGHEVAAAAVIDSDAFRSIFGGEPASASRRALPGRGPVPLRAPGSTSR